MNIYYSVANIFMANEPLVGRQLVEVTDYKAKKDWALFVKQRADQYPKAKKITLVMDNFKTHGPLPFIKPLYHKKLIGFGIDFNLY